jgi:hypothetical protein
MHDPIAPFPGFRRESYEREEIDDLSHGSSTAQNEDSRAMMSSVEVVLQNSRKSPSIERHQDTAFAFGPS